MAFKIARLVICLGCIVAGVLTREMDFITWAMLLMLASDIDYMKARDEILARPTTEGGETT